jgi:hypothetical protein
MIVHHNRYAPGIARYPLKRVKEVLVRKATIITLLEEKVTITINSKAKEQLTKEDSQVRKRMTRIIDIDSIPDNSRS